MEDGRLVEWTGWPPLAEVETGAPAAIEVADTFTVIKARAIMAGKRYALRQDGERAGK